MSTTTHLLTCDEAAALLRMLPARVARLARRGVIPCVRLPDEEIRFEQTDLIHWVERHKQPAVEVSQ